MSEGRSMSKVTKIRIAYPDGQQPTMVIPPEYRPFRFALGRPGDHTCLIVGMNPSAAREEYSDRTVNKVIKTVQELGYDGWIMTNLYPERATDAKNMDEFDLLLAKENAEQIIALCDQYKIKEVWGAWGDPPHENLIKAKEILMKRLGMEKIDIFHFGELTKSGNPRHPLYLKIDGEKRYLRY